STRGIGKTLPHLLATDLWFRTATGCWTRGSGRFHSGFFRAAAGAPRPGCCSQGERALAFLSADVTETFPRQRAAPCNGNQARQRTTAGATGRTHCEGANRDGTSRASQRGPAL